MCLCFKLLISTSAGYAYICVIYLGHLKDRKKIFLLRIIVLFALTPQNSLTRGLNFDQIVVSSSYERNGLINSRVEMIPTNMKFLQSKYFSRPVFSIQRLSIFSL